jgi:hypothetical protein
MSPVLQCPAYALDSADDDHHHHAHDDDDHADEHGADDRGHDDHDHDEESDEPRHADAHQHGGASLAVAREGRELFIEFETPLYNLVGFEHAPRTADEVELVNNARATLKQPDRLFAFAGKAGCTARDAVEVHGFADDADDDESGREHRDILAAYSFDCGDSQRVDSVDVRLFKAFSRLEELDAVYLDDTTQRAQRLTPANARFTLTR